MADLDYMAAEATLKKAEYEFLTPNSEKALKELLELRERIDVAIKTARQSAENILKALG